MDPLVLTIPIIQVNLKQMRNNMTKNKWLDIVDTENEKAVNTHPEHLSPENWDTVRKSILNFVNVVDEATEVYNMENGKK